MAPIKKRKIALMGFRSVGKSSLTIQFVEGQFVDLYDPTVENTFNKRLNLRGQEYDIDLVDTAGQDEYSTVDHSNITDMHGYCLVYSINNVKSFEVVKVIYDKLLDMTGKIQIPIILVGNKVDLHLERVVSTEDGKKLANRMKALFLEVSAKENHSVTTLFHSLLNGIDNQIEPPKPSSGLSNPSSNSSTSASHNEKSGSKCTIS